MKSKKVYAWLLAVSMIFACFTTPILAEGEGTASEIYKASDAWYAPADGTAENTYGNHTEWKWERKDSGQDWFDFAKFHTNKQAFGMTPGNVIGDGTVRIAGSAWTTADGAYNHPGVGEGWMVPLRTENPDNAVSKTFIAPKTGKVRLSTEDGSIYGGSGNPGNAANRTAFIRITVNDRQIWPVGGKSLRIPETTTQEYKFEPVEIELYKNDKLRFEVYNGDSGVQSGKYVYWKPVVEYLADSPINNSYDALDADITAKTVTGNAGWEWKNYRGDSGLTSFIDFKGVSSTASMHLFAEPPVDSNGAHNFAYRGKQGTDQTGAFYSTASDSTTNTNAYNAMSRWWVRPTTNSSAIKKDTSLAKIFTAPKSGTVEISAIDADGEAKIYGKKIASNNITTGATVYIKKLGSGDTISTPSDTSGALYTHTFTFDSAYEDQAVSTDFEPITLDVTEGEKLWFVVNAGEAVNGNAKFVHWNPVVTYLSSDDFNMEVDKSSVAFKDAGDTALTSFADIAAADSFSVSANVKLQNALALGEETRSAVMMAVVYDGDGNIAGKGLTEQTINKDSGESVTFNINDITTTKPDAGSVKVFLFDSLKTLNPLSDIGNSPIYASENTEAPAAKSGFRGTVKGNYTGESAAAALYAGSANMESITADDIIYINQNASGDGGKFDIPMPVEYEESNQIVCNQSGVMYSSKIPLYCSANGTDYGQGTEASPYSFQKALQMVENGGEITVMGTVTASSTLNWATNKAITVSGKDDTSVIDIKGIEDFSITCDTTFRNITFDCNDGRDTNVSTNRIIANGHHVIIEDTVKTTKPLYAILGGRRVSDIPNGTNLEVYGGSYLNIYGGNTPNYIQSEGGGDPWPDAHKVTGNCNLIVGGNVNEGYSFADADKSAANYLASTIFGGCYGSVVEGDCNVTLKGNAKAKYVYGSSNGTETSSVTGKITVNIEGGEYMNVYGAAFITEGKTTTAQINMTGGTVEMVGASDSNVGITGDISMNLTGGTITRRVFGGCYNDWSLGFSSENFVKGTVTVVIGPDLNINILDSANSGIFGGSRVGSNPGEEISKLIFVDGAYTKLGEFVGEQGSIKVCNSHHDYLVKASAGGTVTSSGASQITITPDIGKFAWVNNKMHSGETLDLTGETTAVDFHEEGYEPKYAVSGTIGDNIISFTLTGSKEGNITPVVINADGLTNGEFSTELIADTYAISVQSADEYEAVVKNASDETITEITVTNAAITGIKATATQKTYDVTVTVDAGVQSVVIKKDGVQVGESITETTTVKLPNGNYIAEMTPKNEFVENTATGLENGGFTVNSAAVSIGFTTKAATYNITGTVTDGVKSVTLTPASGTAITKQDTDFIADGENKKVTISVPAGTYTVTATYDEENDYTADEITGSPITVNKDLTTGSFSVSARVRKYIITVNTDNGVRSVTIKADGQDSGTTKTVENNTAPFELVKANGYIIEIETTDAETVLKEIKVGETDITATKTFDVAAATTITVTTETKTYTVGGTIDANVKSVTLVDKADPSKTYTGTKTDTAVEFKVPKGSYNVVVVCESGYKTTSASTTEINNVAADNLPAITVSTEVITTPVYTVSGSVGKGIASVKLVSGDDEYPGVIGDDGTVEIGNVPDGTYEVIAVPVLGYDNETVTYANGSNVVVNGDGVTDAFTVEAQLKQYPVSGNVDNVNNIERIDILQNNEIKLTVEVSEIDSNGNFEMALPMGEYSVQVTYASEGEAADGTTTGFTVAANGTVTPGTITIKTAVKTYKVTVNADAGVSLLKITRGDFVKEITLSGNKAETELPKANEYTLEITAAEKKVIKSITANGVNITETKKFDVTGETSIVIVTENATNPTEPPKPPEPEDGILSASYSDGKVTVSYNVNTEEDGVLIVAIYNSDNILQAVVSQEIEIGSESADLSIPDVLEQGNTYTLKAMIWNSMESMIPKYEPYPIEFTR